MAAQDSVAGMLRQQRQQAIGQRQQRPEQRVPEDHRKEALIGLPEQEALHLPQQCGRVFGLHAQIATGVEIRRLGIAALPAGPERREAGLRIAATKAPQQHRHMQRQQQPAIGQRRQDPQQQTDQQQRRPQHQQLAQRSPGQARVALDPAQGTQEQIVALQACAPAAGLFQQQDQQQDQKVHARTSALSEPR
ncbi:hypothetical protein D3C80_1264680 [compost metagenome]